MLRLACLMLLGLVIRPIAVAASPDPKNFPLTVHVVSFSEHSSDNKTTNCEDTTIPGYDKTVKCRTLNVGPVRTDLQLEIGGMVYTASCIWCPSLSPGEYKGRWGRNNGIEFLFTDKRGKVRTTRYAIVSAATPPHQSEPIISPRAAAQSSMPITPLANSQEQRPSLDTMLNDANYVFNRYEELTRGAQCEHLQSVSLQQECRELIAASRSNVDSAKSALSRALRAKEPTLLDIFIVYSEVQELTGNLDIFAWHFNQFSNDDATPFALAGAKATILGAWLGVEIKGRLISSCK